MLDWVSEEDRLPPIAQTVLVALPRRSDPLWDIRVGYVFVRHEGVAPHPVKRGDRWPVDFFWGFAPGHRDTSLITGNGFWSSLSSINLPPGAAHSFARGQHWIAQSDFEWIGMQEPRHDR